MRKLENAEGRFDDMVESCDSVVRPCCVFRHREYGGL